jgi:hypothetical protein
MLVLGRVHWLILKSFSFQQSTPAHRYTERFRLPAVGTLNGYSKALEYEYRVKTAALGTLKRHYIISLTLYLE